MNHYPHHIGDYAKDTAHLSLTQHGAYRQMMDMYYRTEKPLPADRTRLHILLRCQSKLDRISVDTVLEEFFQLREDGWHHKRCNMELARYHDKATKAAASAGKRWQSDGTANAMRTHSAGNARAEDKRNANQNQEPRTKNQALLEPPEVEGTRRDQISAQLRAAGVKVTSQNPYLVAWVEARVTDAQLTEAVERARLNKPKPADIPAAYLDPIVREVVEGKAKKLNGHASKHASWWASEQAAERKGRELGIEARVGESKESFYERIRVADANRERTARENA